MGWSHKDVWQLRVRRDVLVVEVPTEELGVPALHRAPHPGAPVQVRRVLTTASWENQQGLSTGETEGCYRPMCPLKGPEHRRPCSQTLALISSEATAAQKAPGTYGKEMNCLASE